MEHIFIDPTNKVWLATNKGIATLEIRVDKPFRYQFQRLLYVVSVEWTALIAPSDARIRRAQNRPSTHPSLHGGNRLALCASC